MYLHNVPEAKLLGPAGVVLSAGSEFIDNADAAAAAGKSAEGVEQDCELKALSRLAPKIKKDYPQTRFVVGGDNLFACGRTLQICEGQAWSYVLAFKRGRMPAVRDEFQRLPGLCPRNVLRRTSADGTTQEYRRAPGLTYTDAEGRGWRFHALQCVETSPAGAVTRYAWVTDLPVSARTVGGIARKGGRYRWKVENEGFNRQKNSGLNLQHVYSTDPEKWQAYYYLLQIAFILTRLLGRGSLLRQPTAGRGERVVKVFGSLSNIARQLREALKYCRWPEECFDAAAAKRRRVSLDSG